MMNLYGKGGLPAPFHSALLVVVASALAACGSQAESADYDAATASAATAATSVTSASSPDAMSATQTPTIPAGASSDSMMKTALTLVVNKSPTCGCCKAWVEHMEKNGFKVETVDHDDMAAVKQKLGVATSLASCHTSTIGDYVLEGHVPAADVKRLLAEKHKAHGLTVPGMPRGSPGMEGPVTDKFDVLLFDTNGQTRVFAKY